MFLWGKGRTSNVFVEIENLKRPRVCGFLAQLSAMFSFLLQTLVCLKNCLSDLAL